MKLKKLLENAIIPTKGSNGAAGYDLYATENCKLKPGERKLFKTGISLAIPQHLYGRIAPRSGLAYKHGIDVLAGVIDCFDEKSKILTTTGEKNIKDIKIGEKIISFNEETMETETDVVSAIIDTGEQEIYDIETDDGVLSVTSGTLVYTTDGVKKAEELSTDDEIIHI